MFPDSKIAQDFACGKTKCTYIVKHGLVPYFTDLLNEKLDNTNYYVALFDESFNYVTKKNQMDMHIRFWDDSNNKVATRYYNSNVG